MAPLIPPPWLINMQRYGPPPSYPGLRIPGLNAPIPEGAQWGYHPGGWGKPPVDEYGRPLYGDVFGASAIAEVPKEVRLVFVFVACFLSKPWLLFIVQSFLAHCRN
jgi:splicing factor 3B subunit 2